MKKHLLRAVCMALVLCLLMPCALAAPYRDARQTDAKPDAWTQTLLEIVLGAAVLRDVPYLAIDETPCQALTEGVMLLEADAENVSFLSYEEMSAIYELMLANGSYETPDESTCPCMTLTPDGVQFDTELLLQTPRTGVYVYSMLETDVGTQLLCDVYTVMAEAPLSAAVWDERELTWLCHATVTLEKTQDTPRVTGYTLSPYYEDGCFADWNVCENDAYEYSCNMPRIFGLAQDEGPVRVYETADSSASLTIRAMEAAGYDELMARFMEAPIGETVMEQKEFGVFWAEDVDRMVLYAAPENVNWNYELVFTFPAERQKEYTLYAEIIRNSFSIWGDSCG